MTHRGSNNTPRFGREQDGSSPGVYRARGRGGSGQTYGRGRGRGGGGGGSGLEFYPPPVEQAPSPSTAPTTGVYQHPHASRGGGRGRGGRGRGGGGGQNFNSWCTFKSSFLLPACPFITETHSNSPGASGQSSPRGYPPRNKFVQQGPPQRGGGLGFQNPNISSAFRSNNTSNQFGEPQRTTRGTSDPRLWIPIKFVKGTSLTDKSLENPPEENLDEIEGKQKKPETQKYTPPIPGKLQPYAPEVIPQPTSPSDRLWEIEEVTPASAEQWQTDFPGIFKQECSSSTFQTLPSTPQASESTTPADVAILGETGSSGDNKSNEPHIITNDSQETSTKSPETSKITTPEPENLTSKSPSAVNNSVPPAADETDDSGALFFIDAEGDPANKVSSYTSIVIPKMDELSINKETDDEEERIVFQPDQSLTTSGSQADDSHLFRTITEPVLSSSNPAQPVSKDSENLTTNSKDTTTKPTKKMIKARQRQARKERRKRAANDGPYHPGMDTRPDNLDSGSDIDWGSDSDEEPTSTFLPSETTKEDKKSSNNKAQRSVYKNKEEMELCEDYIKHAMMAEKDNDDDEDEGDQPELDKKDATDKFLNDSFTRTFMDGMAAQDQHPTIDDLDHDARMKLEDDELALEEVKIEPLDLYESDSDMEGSTESGSADEGVEEEEEEEDDDDDSSSIDDIDDVSVDKSPEISMDALTDLSGDSDGEEEVSAIVEDVLGKEAKGKRRQKKGDKLKVTDGELINFVEDLQKSWKMDRIKKAERKKARAAARLLLPPKTKKQKKKADRREDNEPPPDVTRLNEIIRDFICFRIDENVLILPPVSKDSRAAVHEIANLYHMKSRSRGSGKRRHPVLTRTKNTTHILPSRQPLFRILNRSTDPRNQNSGSSSSARLVPRNKEGALVGQGVAHIGAENVGFKLLTKMGWSLGQTMGDPTNTTALQRPLMAVMKNSKGGLGMAAQVRYD
ncbi:hypothetical protein PSTT_15005 [Puccinia striiformis]|uniref:Protein SQS1 n=1 Tax=Puccinia striiformis TaxID=27350 RepID=A0A2S4UJQ6_9BASI|nr:hypothetical protein PSTT_15005 [Puccinia striiformis]